MGATNQTDTLGLPLFTDIDMPSWRGDINRSHRKIDDAVTLVNAEIVQIDARNDADELALANARTEMAQQFTAVATRNTADETALADTRAELTQQLASVNARNTADEQQLADMWSAMGQVFVANPTHSALQAALTANPLSEVVASGEYSTNQQLTIHGNCDLSNLTINYTGTGTAVRVGDPSKANFRQRVNLPRIIHAGKTQNGWAQVAGSIGVMLVNQYASIIDVPYVKYFECGLFVAGANGQGSQQNSIYVGQLDNNKINMRFGFLDPTGWSNQNNIYGGRCSHNSNEGAQVPGVTHVQFDKGANTVNNNNFFGTSLESPNVVEYHVVSMGATDNNFYGCRWENTNQPNRRVLSDGISRRNAVFGGIYADTIVSVNTNGGSSFMVKSAVSETILNMSGGVPLHVQADGSGAAIALAVTGPNIMQDATKNVAANYSWALSATTLRGKGTNEANPRVVIDATTGRISLGNGANPANASLVGVPGYLFVNDGTIMGGETDGGFSIGNKTTYRPNYVRAKTAHVTGAFTTANRPAVADAGVGALIFDTDARGIAYSVSDNWVVPFAGHGSATGRPPGASCSPGTRYFDTTLKRSIEWNGTAWQYPDGTLVP